MLYAYDLCLTADSPHHMQTMLNHLDAYAKRKGLTINAAMLAAKSEVVRFFVK